MAQEFVTTQPAAYDGAEEFPPRPSNPTEPLTAMSMPSALPFPIRKECPPGACDCGRDALLDDPQGDLRILRLTREEEKQLIARIDRIATHAELMHVRQLMQAQLGMVVDIAPGRNEVRTTRGIQIRIAPQPGLCRKVRQSVPAAIRRCLDRHPEIAHAILDAHDLLGQAAPDASQPDGA